MQAVSSLNIYNQDMMLQNLYGKEAKKYSKKKTENIIPDLKSFLAYSPSLLSSFPYYKDGRQQLRDPYSSRKEGTKSLACCLLKAENF